MKQDKKPNIPIVALMINLFNMPPFGYDCKGILKRDTINNVSEHLQIIIYDTGIPGKNLTLK